MRNNKCSTWFRCINVLGFGCLLSLIPLYLITRYNFPAADDFFYLGQTLTAWEQTESVAAVVQAAVQQTVERYFEWQGNFSFIFLTFLQPASFGEQYYGLTAVITLTTLILCELYFLKVVLRSYMKASGSTYWIVSLLLLFLAIQYMYEPVEGLYWHPGAISYTFFYALGLWMDGLMLQMMRHDSLHRRLLCFVPALLLAPVVGGSNYSIALVSSMLLFLLVIYLLWKRQRQNAVLSLVVLVLLTVALLISILAPGNGMRQDTVGEASVIKGFVTSVVYAVYSMANATTVPVLLVWLFIAPLIYRLAKSSKQDFSHPLWAIVLLFGLYAALGMPCFYALGFAIPERNINLIYFSYYPVVLCAMYYLMGWFSHKFTGKESPLSIITLYEKRFGTVFAVFCLMFALSCGGQMVVGKGEDGGLAIYRMPAGLSAAYSMLTGEAQEYHAQMLEREEICRSASGEDVVLQPLTAEPWVLTYLDITEDPADWKNKEMAEYSNPSVSAKISHFFEMKKCDFSFSSNFFQLLWRV